MLDAPRLERLVARRNVLDRHSFADFAPEEVARLNFVRGQLAPAELGDPAHRLEMERGQNVQEVLVGNVVDAMEAVDAP